jgi:hypothetical protein
MWDVLGIAPTADPRAIRRAYAVRLRQIDPDRDLAGFARLRQALEWGLAQAAQPARPTVERNAADLPADLTPRDPRHDAEPVVIRREELNADIAARRAPIASMPREETPHAPAPAVDAALDRSLLVGLESALQRRDAREAARLYIRASATGALPLGDAERMLARLFTVALADARFERAEFRALAATFGWDRPQLDSAVVSDVRQRVSARLAAEIWYDNLAAVAPRRLILGRKRVRVARLLLRRIRGWGLFRIDRPALRTLLDEHAHHEAWLRDRIDAAWVVTLKRRMRRRELFANASLVLFLGALLLNGVIVFVGGALGLLKDDSAVGFFVIVPIAAVLVWFIRLLLRNMVDIWRRRL